MLGLRTVLCRLELITGVNCRMPASDALHSVARTFNGYSRGRFDYPHKAAIRHPGKDDLLRTASHRSPS